MFQNYSFNIESKKLNGINVIKNNVNNQKNNFFYNEKRIELGEFIVTNKITHANVSRSLAQFEQRFLKLFRLKKYDPSNNNNENTIFFGVYDNNDIKIIKNHTGRIFLMFGGTDLSYNFDKIKIYNRNILFISISEDITKRLIKYISNINNKYLHKIKNVYLNMVNTKLFKPVKNKGSAIYVYDGYINKPQNRDIYNLDLVDEVKNLLPNIKFIYSSKLNVEYEKMPEIYAKCFIGLRLTNNDGNANTVQEMEAMNIPIIHNQSIYGLKWNSVQDIINHIYKCMNKSDLNKILQAKREKENQEKNLKYELENTPKYDFYNSDKLDDDMMKNINNNIETFTKLVKPYKNILFVCTDYPGFGGAATNCNNLQMYFTRKGHSCYGFYYHYEKSETKKKTTYEISNINKINNINFKPDLIILKSFVAYDLSKFKCPIYYLVGGIYLNSLNDYYYNLSKKKQNKHINKYVIEEIKKSTLTFVNSSHTQEILQEQFNLKTHLFYSTFISFKNRTIENESNATFKKRIFNFGLIVSDFDRPIKNITRSIELLRKYSNKKSIILIGKNSKKYQNYGFTCIDLVSNNDLMNYYKKIKCVVQDSFYESCSNVKIEALMCGCLFKKNIDFVLLEQNDKYIFKKNTHYIVGNINNEDFQLLRKNYYNINYDCRENNLANCFTMNAYNSYIVQHGNCSSIILFVLVSSNTKIDYETLLKNAEKNNKCIVSNNVVFDYNKIIELFHRYGKCSVPKDHIGLSLFYDNYTFNTTRKYNRDLYVMIMAYYNGENNKDNSNIVIDLSKDIFHNKTVLIINKLISGYGGVQKTGYQIMNLLEDKYNIKLLSNNSIGKKYANNTLLNNDIPQSFLVNISEKDEISNYINNNDFEIIINNKLNDILTYQIKKRMSVICHNSNDPFNNVIIDNQRKIDKVLTINQFHKNLLISNGVKNKISLYKNFIDSDYVENNNMNISERNTFFYNIVYIGRLSLEKNIQPLINGVKKYNDINIFNKIKLYIIGSGNVELNNINENIILVGFIPFDQIIKYYNIADYVISNSLTEGKPFSIIEAQVHGIPCIHSNINGINEIIFDNDNGFLYNIRDYCLFNTDMNFNRLKTVSNDNNTERIKEVLIRAYSISFDKWLDMSKKSIIYTKDIYDKDFCTDYNYNLIKNNIFKSYKKNNINMKTLFINFKPDVNLPHGGGNISTYYIIDHIKNNFNENVKISYSLEENIDIYFVIDPLKDNKFKKYSLEDIVNHRNTHNINSKIIIRINDCDKTRTVNRTTSRELQILKYFNSIDYFIFNSNFIKDYYYKLFRGKEYNLESFNINHTVIHNGCDSNIFKNKKKRINMKSKEKIKYKIVTHHWSSNVNKGYRTYLELWNHTQKNKNCEFEFVFIGKNVPEFFKSVPIHGPFVKDALSNELNKNHIYITDSQYDSCPNHVIEAISCGLPILCSNKPGGAKELCTLPQYKIGEIYNDFNDLLKKITMIKNNYNSYRENIAKVQHLYQLNSSIEKYCYTILKNTYETHYYKVLHEKNIIYINNYSDDGFIVINNKILKLISGINVFAFKKNEDELLILCKNYSYKIYEFGNMKKLNNKKINILLCSDSNYYVGLFATLNSVIENSHFIDNTHFNFIVNLDYTNEFYDLLNKFETKINKKINKTVIHLDGNILDPVFYNTSCYNSGGHLLNIGNISRLLLGEFMEYKKLLYLDSDSIVQYDIINKLMYFDLKCDLYAKCANKINKKHKKQIIIKMKNLINENITKSTDSTDSKEIVNIKDIIYNKIKMDDYAYMGAPFLTNCQAWSDIYKKTIELIKLHNKEKNGIYKLFTMSIQNILFYNRTKDITEIFDVLQDLGSKRKEWDKTDISNKYVLDWSGNYKPWFNDGLYRNHWLYYDILGLSKKYKNARIKNEVEKFNKK